MKNKLSKAMEISASQKLTENGGLSFDKLLIGKFPKNLTLFGIVGSLRSREVRDIEQMFAEAFHEDGALATRLMFYAGDVRQGLGERRVFNIMLKWMANNQPEILRKNIIYIPVYNRFDSWYTLVDTPIEDSMWENMKAVYTLDHVAMSTGDNPTLLAKWMKSINTSSAKSRELGFKTMKALGFKNEKEYRQKLSRMRARLRVTEKLMSANRWDGIEYSAVPSYAMKNYASAFTQHDRERFEEFMKKVVSGEEKINASVLYPYDLAEIFIENIPGYCNEVDKTTIEVANAQWKALPNYLEGNDMNVLCMADISESMIGRPMASSIGLSVYFAERNKGAFHNQLMTFSSDAKFVKLEDSMTPAEKINKVYDTQASYTTDLDKCFRVLLKTAVSYDVPAEDMPKAIIILSDNEIDRFQHGYGEDIIKTHQKQFKEFGYELPKIVFFQVESRHNTFLTQENSIFVSGQSASTFKSLLANLDKTGEEVMWNTLMSERYDLINV